MYEFSDSATVQYIDKEQYSRPERDVTQARHQELFAVTIAWA